MRSTVLLLALLGGLATATSLFVLSNRTMFGFALSLTPQISGASTASTSKSGDVPKSFQQARQQQFESWTITCQAVADRCRMVQQLARLSPEGEPQRFIHVALQVGPGGIVEATIVVEGRRFWPATVQAPIEAPPGTVLVDKHARQLYLLREGGLARRYGIAVGAAGHAWTGDARREREPSGSTHLSAPPRGRAGGPQMAATTKGRRHTGPILVEARPNAHWSLDFVQD